MKRFLIPALVAATVVTAMPAPAAAQGTPIEDNPLAARRRARANPQTPGQNVAATRADLIRAVSCQLADPASVEPILATAPYSAQEAAEAARILPLLRRCIGARAPFTTPPPALRGTIAEAVLEARFATPQAARSPELGVKPLLDVAAATARPDAASLTVTYAIAQCIAANHAGPVRALLATEPAAQAETDAIQGLGSPLGLCARAVAAAGGEIRVDGRTLRGLLAESLYRWSVVQRDGPTSPWAAPAAPAAR